MRLRFATGLSLAWLSVAALASAEERPLRPYEAALGLGYSSGSLFGVQGFTFIALEAGYHWSPRWTVGPYAEVGFIDTTQGSGSPGSTQTFLGHHYRFGAQAMLQLFPTQLIDPWLGAGVGYAALGLDVHSAPDQGSTGMSAAYRETARGFEWLSGQCGVNLNLSKALALGAFGRLSLVDYLSQQRSQNSGAAPHESTRAWLSAGAKATLRF